MVNSGAASSDELPLDDQPKRRPEVELTRFQEITIALFCLELWICCTSLLNVIAFSLTASAALGNFVGHFNYLAYVVSHGGGAIDGAAKSFVCIW